MSRKKETQWKQRLIDAMNAEAEAIEREAEPFRTELSQKQKDEMYQNIMQGIREKDIAARANASDTENGAKKKTRRREKKSFWRQPLKVAGVLTAAAVLVFGMSLTSEGNRMYWLGKWRALFGYNSVEQSNNGGDSIKTETSEQEARKVAWDELGISMPEFYYLPDGTDFVRATIDLENCRVMFQYGEQDYIYLTAIKNDTDATVQSGNPNGRDVETVRAGAQGENIEMEIMEDSSGGEEFTVYIGKWNYENCGYKLTGVPDKIELTKILQNMQYIQ